MNDVLIDDINDWQLGYIAGMIDAECHIGIQRLLPPLNPKTRTNQYRNPHYAIRFELAMTDRKPVDFINGLLRSGKIIAIGARGRRLPYYRLRIIRQECLALLRATLPFIQGKRRQVELCLELDALRLKYSPSRQHFGKAHFQPLPQEYVDAADKIFKEFRKLQLNKKPRQGRLL